MKPWDNTVSIRTKIVITIIVISTCVALLGGILAFWLSREMLTNHLVSDLKIAATQHVNEVSLMLDSASASIDALAQENEIIDLAKEQNEQTRSSASMTVSHFNARNEFYSFDVLDVLGNVIYSTNPTKMGMNKSEHDFYKQGITGVVSVEVSKGSALQNVELFAYAPIKTKEGYIIGVVVGEYNPEHIFLFLEASKGALQFDHAIITDEYGVVVYSDRKELLFKSIGVPSALAQVKIAERWRQYVVRVIDATQADIQNAVETRGESATFFKKNGSWFDTQMVLVSRLGDKPFSLILESNIEYITGQVFRATIFIALLMLFMAFIIALFVALYISRFLRPIGEMLRFAKEVSNEKFDAPLLITSNDEKEFQELGEELTSMAKKLKGVKSHLEEAIQEKTKTISGKIEELEEAKISALSMLEDLTVSRNKLEIENAKNNAILSSIDNGVLVTDKDGRLLFANNNIETLFNWKLSEKLGSRFERLMKSAETFQGEPISEASNIIKAALQGTSISGHFIIVRDDGKKIPLYYAASPIMQAGRSIGSVTVVRDVTEEKKLDDSRTTFISTAAHQLRTPLTAVSWFGEMLAEGIGGTLTDRQVAPEWGHEIRSYVLHPYKQVKNHITGTKITKVDDVLEGNLDLLQ
jgi:PAS domain S-box-containing protein